MEFEFEDAYLEEVYYEAKASVGHGPAVDKGFRKVMGLIREAHNELDLRKLKGCTITSSAEKGIINTQWTLLTSGG